MTLVRLERDEAGLRSRPSTARREGGIPAADQAVREEAGDLFATDDLQRAVKSFLEQGPGHARFEGR